MKGILKIIGIFAGVFGALAIGTRSCNNAFNDKSIDKPAYHTESHTTGVSGHVEYTRYSDGSQDVKIYPGLSPRIFDSELYQDLNGDGLVDRIRREGSELKMSCLSGLLVREYDYLLNKKVFDEADKQLRELMTRYPLKK